MKIADRHTWPQATRSSLRSELTWGITCDTQSSICLKDCNLEDDVLGSCSQVHSHSWHCLAFLGLQIQSPWQYHSVLPDLYPGPHAIFSLLSQLLITDATFQSRCIHFLFLVLHHSRTIYPLAGDLSLPGQSRFLLSCRPPDDYSAEPMARSRVGSALTFHLNKASWPSSSWPLRFEYQCLTRQHSAASPFCPISEGNTIPRGELCDNRPRVGWLANRQLCLQRQS